MSGFPSLALVSLAAALDIVSLNTWLPNEGCGCMADGAGGAFAAAGLLVRLLDAAAWFLQTAVVLAPVLLNKFGRGGAFASMFSVSTALWSWVATALGSWVAIALCSWVATDPDPMIKWDASNLVTFILLKGV